MWVCITILGFAVVPEVKNSARAHLTALRGRPSIEPARHTHRHIVTNPAGLHLRPAAWIRRDVFKFGSLVSGCHDEPNLSSGATVGEIIETEHRCCGNKHGTELHCASTVSQSGGMLPIMSSNRSPRLTPRPRRWLATRDDRSASSANVNFVSGPFSFANQSATWSRRGPRPIWSNQSSAQLNCFKEGPPKVWRRL